MNILGQSITLASKEIAEFVHCHGRGASFHMPEDEGFENVNIGKCDVRRV
jgi:hypothetical protein